MRRIFFTLFIVLTANFGTIFVESGKCDENLQRDLSDNQDNNNRLIAQNRHQTTNNNFSEPKRIVTKEGDVYVRNPRHLGDYYDLVPNDLTPKGVIINSKYTILILEWNNKRTGRTWFNVSPDAHISVMYDTPKGKEYKLLDAEKVPIAPNSIDVPQNYTMEFILYFEPISKEAGEICYIDPGLDQPCLWRIQLYY